MCFEDVKNIPQPISDCLKAVPMFLEDVHKVPGGTQLTPPRSLIKYTGVLE